VRVKQAMMASAVRKVLMVDSEKFDRVALHLFADLKEFDVVYVDDRLPVKTADALRAAGVSLKLVTEND